MGKEASAEPQSALLRFVQGARSRALLDRRKGIRRRRCHRSAYKAHRSRVATRPSLGRASPGRIASSVLASRRCRFRAVSGVTGPPRVVATRPVLLPRKRTTSVTLSTISCRLYRALKGAEKDRTSPKINEGDFMPRITVTTDPTTQHASPVLLDERVYSIHLSDDHSAAQLLERLSWAIADAENAQRAEAATL